MKARILFIIWAALVAAGCSREVTTADWQQDLRTLEKQLAERHVDLYHQVSAEEFAAAVDDLHERLPALTPPEILVGMAQVVAMVGDGHTSFYPGNQKRWWFGFYPARFYWFEDGFHLIAATPENAHLFGKHLVAIDDTPIEEAVRRISTTIGADNDMEYRYTVPFQLIRPEMLHVLGIADSPDSAVFVFDDGTRQSFTAMTKDEYLDREWVVSNGSYAPEGKPPSLRHEFLFASPLIRPHLEQWQFYWYEYLEEDRTVFMQYNVCWDQKGEPTFAEFTEELFRFLDVNPVERLVIDMRQNSGGEPTIAEPLVAGLEQRPEWGAEGRLFVLTGRRTFSAALTNAAQLRARAGARVVGEAPRGKPNNPSEGRDIDLKRTGIWVTVSTQFVERDPALGDVAYLPVDIPVGRTWEDHRLGRDPELEAALAAASRR
ncbi:MAG: hypothetical protein GY906_07370 [bacterium]|nr:hypothetical protein [bacterium]